MHQVPEALILWAFNELRTCDAEAPKFPNGVLVLKAWLEACADEEPEDGNLGGL
jgi:hypothetical protein